MEVVVARSCDVTAVAHGGSGEACFTSTSSAEAAAAAVGAAAGAAGAAGATEAGGKALDPTGQGEAGEEDPTRLLSGMMAYDSSPLGLARFTTRPR